MRPSFVSHWRLSLRSLRLPLRCRWCRYWPHWAWKPGVSLRISSIVFRRRGAGVVCSRSRFALGGELAVGGSGTAWYSRTGGVAPVAPVSGAGRRALGCGTPPGTADHHQRTADADLRSKLWVRLHDPCDNSCISSGGIPGVNCGSVSDHATGAPVRFGADVATQRATQRPRARPVRRAT